MRAIVRKRLAAAVRAISQVDPATREPGRLVARLCAAFAATESYAEQADVLAHARSWSVIVTDESQRTAKGEARDAIGALWAVAEEGL